MYNGTPRDHGEKKRQRLTNELWMEAIMNKGKTPEGFTSTSTLTPRAVPTTVASPAVEREGVLNVTPTWGVPTPQTSMAQQQYVKGYQERPTERLQNRFQGRKTESFSQQVRGMPTEIVSPHQKRMVNVSGAPGYAVRADAVAGYHGRPADTSSPFPHQNVKLLTMDYQSRTEDGATVDQRRPVDEAVADHYRLRDGAASECQGKPTNEPARHQERTSGIAYEPGKFGQDPTSYQSGLHQGRVTGGKLGKMAEDYKKDRKLPPRVEEMLREQVNLDESALHDAFAVAMEDLILEHEANFVAKGVCHLCVSKVYLPVVNFCPYADENHSLCREHLRSVYRVRMEALFVGRNGSAPNRRLLRCLACTRGCPCNLCRAEKEKDIRNYKRYLLDTLRRCGHSSESAVRDDRATAAIAPPAPERRSTFGVAQSLGKTDGHRYTQYVPAPPAKKLFLCSRR
uniref:Uncharacterized protein n=1 Tax=Peronospora matthiolae TaxID=2874970 RepID=A0AAV1UX04_9STRA